MTNIKKATKTEVAPKTLDQLYVYEDLYKASGNNKSAVIRQLTAEGFKRGPIAKFMNIRYQHVRNVQMQPLKKVTTAK